jgi:hypothetical protein
MAQLLQSNTLPLVPRLIGLIGPQSQGKTTCAATISDFYPGDCKDTVLFAFDSDATVSLQSRGINIPTFQFVGISDWPTLEKELIDACKQVRTMAADGVVKNVILDTASMFDLTLFNWFFPRTPDTIALALTLQRWHRWLLIEQFFAVPNLRLVYTFQPKTKETNDKNKDKIQKQNKAMGLDADTDKVLGLYGNGPAGMYRQQASIIVPVFRRKTPGKPDEFLLDFSPATGFESKNRYPFLAEKEEANLNKLYKKIQNLGKT